MGLTWANTGSSSFFVYCQAKGYAFLHFSPGQLGYLARECVDPFSGETVWDAKLGHLWRGRKHACFGLKDREERGCRCFSPFESLNTHAISQADLEENGLPTPSLAPPESLQSPFLSLSRAVTEISTAHPSHRTASTARGSSKGAKPPETGSARNLCLPAALLRHIVSGDMRLADSYFSVQGVAGN